MPDCGTAGEIWILPCKRRTSRAFAEINLKLVVAERTLILQDARGSGLAMSELIHALHRI